MTKLKELTIRRGFWKECVLWIVGFVYLALFGINSPVAYVLFGGIMLGSVEHSNVELAEAIF